MLSYGALLCNIVVEDIVNHLCLRRIFVRVFTISIIGSITTSPAVCRVSLQKTPIKLG